MTKGTQLNQRVWRLFERAGFKTEPNSNNPAEHVVNLGAGKIRTVDLFAEISELGVRLISENTISAQLDEPITNYVHDLTDLMEAESAGAGLLVYPSKEPSPEDREYARQRRITIWGESELSYYEAVPGATGEYARYEICHALCFQTSEEKVINNVLALRFRQPAPDTPGSYLYVFTLAAQDLCDLSASPGECQGVSEDASGKPPG